MSDRVDFLAGVLDRHLVALQAFHDGDPGPWRELWSGHEPLSLYPPGRPAAFGREQVVPTFERAAARLSHGSDARLEVHRVEVGGDVGVLVGVEHGVFSVEGGPPHPQGLRVTLVYRRVDGDWRIVHRHADSGPEGAEPERR